VKLVLDTSVLIDGGFDFPDDEVAVSSVSWAELACGVAAAPGPVERSRRQSRLARLQEYFGAGLPFDDAAAAQFGIITGLVISHGRNPRSRALDHMIAATAAAHGAAVVTRHPDDFAGLDAVVTVLRA
jgi:predicted nucleic acid-binding protein